MDSSSHKSFLVADRSFLAVIKKDIHHMAAEGGCSAAQLANLDIVIAEIGSNFIKHAGSGELLVRIVKGEAIEILGIDNGPGMADPTRMMEDGVSTANTLGGGLGAIKRLSDHSQIYSQKGWGTIVFSRILLKKRTQHKAEARPFELYGLCVPYPGEEVCGDGFAQVRSGHLTKIFLGDGLGHGAQAHAAVQAAIAALNDTPETSPVEIIRQLHKATNKTRGLVGTIAVYNAAQKAWQLCGVGNIATRIQSGIMSKNYMAYNGIVGHSIPRTMNEQTIQSIRGQYLILCSDGLRSRWDGTKYPNIFRYDPCIMAAALYKDFTRRSDDASVVVIRMT